MEDSLHVGLLINPLAGLGGQLARKGSDGYELRELAAAMAPEQRLRAQQRAERALAPVYACPGKIRFSSWAGDMGGALLEDLGLPHQVFGERNACLSSSADTRAAAAALAEGGVDLLLFAGGDGTAREILDTIGLQLPVLGIPAGVKMHSGVFAVSPEAAGELLVRLAAGGLVDLKRVEVRDIDEQAFRADRVKTRFYGEMLVPAQGQFLQQTKVAGKEDPELAAAEIATWVAENLAPERTYLIGPGSTTAAITRELGLQTTLLGVDVIRNGALLASDADEQSLLALLDETPGEIEIIVTAIGGQGHIFGRGNQQLSPAVIRRVGINNVTVVAAKSKISGLQGRPLLADTNDPELDAALQGYRVVITGYDDQILYRVGVPWE